MQSYFSLACRTTMTQSKVPQLPSQTMQAACTPVRDTYSLSPSTNKGKIWGLPQVCINPMALLESFHPSLCLTLVVVLSVQLPPSLHCASFVFGDSLVDAGNNDYLFTLSKADSPPYGIDFAPSGGRPTGRFTNGKTISDIIGKKTLQS